MTKSQNTKNEQQKDLCITSEQLTEQWKKGELPEGHYYIKTRSETNIDEYIQWYKDHGIPSEKSFAYFNVQQVLAPVPSYEVYKDLIDGRKMLREYIKDTTNENAQLKKQINHLLKTQARQFVDNQKLQVKAEKAKDVVNIDTARQIKQLKELLKEFELWFTGIVGNMNDKNVGEHNKSVPIGNFEHIFKEFSQKIDEVLK